MAKSSLAGSDGALTWVNNATKKEELETANKNDSTKKLSVERVYQKKTQLEHILLRPDTYIGSVEPLTQLMWVYDEDVGMNCREVTFVPGLYKIFDEILVNAADNKQRDGWEGLDSWGDGFMGGKPWSSGEPLPPLAQ